MSVSGSWAGVLTVAAAYLVWAWRSNRPVESGSVDFVAVVRRWWEPVVLAAGAVGVAVAVADGWRAAVLAVSLGGFHVVAGGRYRRVLREIRAVPDPGSEAALAATLAEVRAAREDVAVVGRVTLARLADLSDAIDDA